MKYDLTLFPLDNVGNQLADDLTKKPVTYREALMKAIANDLDPDGRPIPSTQKYTRYDLYTKIRKNDGSIIDFTIDEVAMLNTAALAFPLIVAGQVRDYLDNPVLGQG